MKQNLNDLADSLEYSWTAVVRLSGGQIITIWYTAWPMTRNRGSEILSISSDLPKQLIHPAFIVK